MTTTPDVEYTTRRWRRVEYDRLVELGMFIGERLELLDGLLVVGEPQGSSHAATVMHVGQVLTSAFGVGWHARLHAPLALDDDSEPEPDVAIVVGVALDYRTAHPSTAVLLVEVAESSLRLDRRVKAEVYARARLAEYWIVNLVDRAVEVYRDPAIGATGDASYRSIMTLRPPETITPLSAPHATIAIANLLPG
jgi:Uma2 family endonuclease